MQIMLAAQEGHIAAVAALAMAGAALDLQDNDGGNTALALAAEQGKLGVVEALIAAGADPNEPEHAEQIATCYDTELAAFYSREGAREKGVRVGKTIHDFRPRSELSFEDRKKALEKAKANSRCKKCGRPEGALGWRPTVQGRPQRRQLQRRRQR